MRGVELRVGVFLFTRVGLLGALTLLVMCQRALSCGRFGDVRTRRVELRWVGVARVERPGDVGDSLMCAEEHLVCVLDGCGAWGGWFGDSLARAGVHPVWVSRGCDE